MNYLKGLGKGMHRGQGGFTLIELLIVIAILGIVAAVVALNIGGFFGQGKEQAANTEAHQVQTAIIGYMAEGNLSSVSGGTITPGTCGNSTEQTMILCYLMNPSMLQAHYTYGTDGAITAADESPVADSKWTGCGFSGGMWTCP